MPEAVMPNAVMPRAVTPRGFLPRAAAPYLAVFLLALGARGLYLWELADSDLLAVLLGDGRQYHAWAQEIAAGDWIGGEVFYQAPLYPYFMAVVSTLFGPGLWPLRILQVLMGAASCVFVALAGRRFWSLRTGLTAGALVAVYPPAVFFDALIQKTSLSLFLISALLALLATMTREMRARWLLVSGAVLGLLALTRENALVLVPVLLVWLVLEAGTRRQRALRVVLLTAGLGAVLLPVGLRNLAIGGRFLVTTSQLGPNFYIGNNPDANGRYRPLRAGRQDARVERRDAAEMAEAAAGRSLSPAEVSSYWLKRSLAYVAESPGSWLSLLAKKAFLVVNAGEVIDTESIEVYREHSRWLDLLARLFHFGVLGSLAVLGLWTTRRAWRRLWVLYAFVVALAASLVLFYVVARYRFSLVPAVALFAAAGLVEIFERIRSRDLRPLLPGLVLVVLAAVVQNRPLGDGVLPRATTYYNLGVNLFEEGKDERASLYLGKAVALVPDFADGHFSLAKVLAARGDGAGAIESYERAVALRPDHAEAHFDLAFLLISQGQLERASRHLRLTLSIDPRQALARNLLGNILAQQGKLQEASEQYREALRVDRNLADAHFKLGLILSDQGRLEEALGHLEEAARLLPDFPEVHRRLAAVRRAIEEM